MGPAKWCTKKSASSVLLPSFRRHTLAGPHTSKKGEEACALFTFATNFAPSDATKPREHSESNSLKIPIGLLVSNSMHGVLSGKHVLSQSMPVWHRRRRDSLTATSMASSRRVDAIAATASR